jgi:hypothetical protein
VRAGSGRHAAIVEHAQVQCHGRDGGTAALVSR